MKLAILSFTASGKQLGERLCRLLTAQGHQVAASSTKAGADLHSWTAAWFTDADGLIYIGAAAIAVRAIAPHLKSKTTDPAVLCVDELGRFVIPLLSGHIGGANSLARQIGALLGATAVITTATDLHGLFAVDTWAKSQGLALRNAEAIKRVSGKLLDGETVRVFSEFPVAGALPAGLLLVGEEEPCDLYLGIHPCPFPDALQLIPPIVCAGMGCRRGIVQEILERSLRSAFQAANLCPQALGKIASIDRKAGEPGLLALCHKLGLPFLTYTAGELMGTPGSFTPSPFVEATVGVDNVCERSAVQGSGGRLLLPKQVGDGVTVALAAAPYQVDFSTTNT